MHHQSGPVWTSRPHDDHEFVDSAGSRVVGRQACLEAWRGFFASFPDYKNVFAQVTLVEDDTVCVITGHSECMSNEMLAGPALRSERVAPKWQT